MIHVVLYQPEIPPNTGNVIRLCANTGASLHLVRPLGFEFDDARLRRAGLDYHEFADVRLHDSFDALRAALPESRVLAFTTRGATRHDRIAYLPNDILLFGPETRGLPQAMIDPLPTDQRVRLPMRPGNRSVNLSNAVAVAVYEVWRQAGFDGSV